jgi:hypothetical protein
VLRGDTLISILPLAVRTDLCQHLDWNPITSSQSTSTFAGLFAGFVFASIIVILANREKIENRSADAARALKLLVSAFFGLAIVAYLCGIVRGEQECERAQTESAFNAASLAVGAIVVMVALSWLVLAFDRHESGVLSHFRKVVVFGAVFVTGMLLLSSVGYVQASVKGSTDASNYAMVAFTVVSVFAICAFAWRLQLHARDINGDVPAGEETKKRLDRRAGVAAWASLAFFGLSSVASSLAASRPRREWYPIRHWIVYSTGWLTLAGPVVVIVLCVRALARVPGSKESAN